MLAWVSSGCMTKYRRQASSLDSPKSICTMAIRQLKYFSRVSCGLRGNFKFPMVFSAPRLSRRSYLCSYFDHPIIFLRFLQNKRPGSPKEPGTGEELEEGKKGRPYQEKSSSIFTNQSDHQTPWPRCSPNSYFHPPC